MAFSGFRPEAIAFLAELAANNERSWFLPRKAEYERLLKVPLEELCTALADQFAARGLPFHADPRRSPFRFHRDTRFSRDKSPYKTHVGASFRYMGARVTDAGATPGPGPDLRGNGGYFSFGPGQIVVGGGMYDPGQQRLSAFRTMLVEDPARVRAALDDAGFVRVFGGAHALQQLKRLPPGYPAEHPMAERLRWKDVVFVRHLSDEEAFAPDLPARLADDWAAALPVFQLLDALG